MDPLWGPSWESKNLGAGRDLEVGPDAPRGSERRQVQHARQEYHLNLVANDSVKQAGERGRRPGALLDEDGREVEGGGCGEGRQTLLGAVDFGFADQQVRPHIGIRPRQLDRLAVGIRSTVAGERVAGPGCMYGRCIPGAHHCRHSNDATKGPPATTRLLRGVAIPIRPGCGGLVGGRRGRRRPNRGGDRTSWRRGRSPGAERLRCWRWASPASRGCHRRSRSQRSR